VVSYPEFTPITLVGHFLSLRYDKFVMSHPKRISISTPLAYTAFFIALVYLLLFHLQTDTLSRPGAQPWNSYADIQNEIARLADHGQNLLLHLPNTGPDANQNAVPFSRIYFIANYLLYPQRAFVGMDDKVINFPDQLIDADHIPSSTWLHQHQVSHIGVVYGIGMIPHLRVDPIPSFLQ